MADIRFERFVEKVCSLCANWSEDCNDFHAKRPKCYWADEFLKAEEYFRKFGELEDYYEQLAEVTPEDEYDYNAESNAYKLIETEIDELERGLSHDVQDDIVEYCRYYAYEM